MSVHPFAQVLRDTADLVQVAGGDGDRGADSVELRRVIEFLTASTAYFARSIGIDLDRLCELTRNGDESHRDYPHGVYFDAETETVRGVHDELLRQGREAEVKP